jgi:hypothetical protein
MPPSYSALSTFAAAWKRRLPMLALLAQLQCGSTQQLLTSGSGSASSAAGSAGALAGGFAIGGSAGTVQPVGGSSGNALPIGGATTVGGTTSAGEGTGGPEGGSSSGGEAAGVCSEHANCPASYRCSDYQCVACEPTPPECTSVCANGFSPQVLSRNGCQVCECVPPSECTMDGDCAGTELCYAGAQCEEGCTTPDCCFGNQCSPAGCAGSAAPSCLVVGCQGGGECLAACDRVSCECNGQAWDCAESAAAGAPSIDQCPQVCGAPG